VPNAEDLRAALKERGWRMTPQRRLILEAITRSRGHISAEQVHREVVREYPEVNLTTVYRTLEVLEGLGYIRHTHVHGEAAQYQRTDEPAHQHVVCTVWHRPESVSVIEPLVMSFARVTDSTLISPHPIWCTVLWSPSLAVLTTSSRRIQPRRRPRRPKSTPRNLYPGHQGGESPRAGY
jgi:Fur family ferric uptake transcriptional regulator